MPRIALAYQIKGEKIKIDGRLDEEIWRRAPSISDFIQFSPDEGRAATEKTFVQIVYDERAIYVAFRALDSRASLIKGYLTRRDHDSPSDWVGFAIDSYNDKRTAFVFLVNPAGVKIDSRLSNDNIQDINWDAVWDVGTRTYANGWVAEFRIPYSQLRFANTPSQTWGFQAMRTLARRNEISYWAPKARDTAGFVSLFGRLEGLSHIPNSNSIQIVPYGMGMHHYLPPEKRHNKIGNPIQEYGFGCDIKYPLANNLTLDVTINPDFGQVESDPSEFNLTAYETYFDEKRPFFLEASNLFYFKVGIGGGDMAGGQLFYSRRIGRTPHYTYSAGQNIGVLQPKATHILGAAKITGRTKNGWSIGLLNAVTKEELTTIYTADTTYSTLAEPFSNYFVTRLQKDFNNGRTTFGGILTNVLRDSKYEQARYLSRTATTGGIDFTHKWFRDSYQVDAALMGSHITGDTLAIKAAQLSSARYFQRPDARHVRYDPGRTSLSGFAARLNLRKISNGHWRWAVGGVARSPGFEINDIGFMNKADFNAVFLWLGFYQYNPGKLFRTFSINSQVYRFSNFAADNIGTGFQLNTTGEFLNYWGVGAGMTKESQHLDTGLLRGGPAFIVPGSTRGYAMLWTDARNPIQFKFYGTFQKYESASYNWNVTPILILRPFGRLDMMLSATFIRDVNDLQYLFPLNSGRQVTHVLGRLERDTFFTTLRLNLTLRPNLTIQFYGMPYISGGTYSHLYSAYIPRALEYENRLREISLTTQPDFSFREFKSNLVLRWEYSAGSTLYLVWSQGITNFESKNSFDLYQNAEALFKTHPENVILIKLSKWLSF